MATVHVVGKKKGAEAGFVKKMGMTGGQLEGIPEKGKRRSQAYRQSKKQIWENVQCSVRPKSFIARKQHGGIAGCFSKNRDFDAGKSIIIYFYSANPKL
jgi:hypothetical protein